MPSSLRLVPLLPLLLLATMLAIGVAIEIVRFDTLLWAPKLPLVALLAFGIARGLRRRSA